MEYPDQSSSWLFGGSSNINSNTRLFGNGFMRPSCSNCGGNDHPTLYCSRYYEEICGYPTTYDSSFDSNQVRSQSNNFSENQFASFCEPQPCQDEEKLTANEERIITMMSSLVDSVQNLKSHNVQMLEEHANRIDSLEHNRLNNERVIEEQAQKIKSLEATVQRLENQLEFYHETHEWRSHKQTGRFECMQLSINHLTEKLREVSKQGAEILNSPTLTDFNDKFEPCESQEISEEHGTGYEKDTCAKRELMSIQSGEVMTEEEYFLFVEGMYGDFPVDQGFKAIRLKTENLNSPPAKVDIWEEDDILGTLFDNPVIMDVPKEMTELNGMVFCKCCGTYCKPQLKACVNMIHAGPTMKKVEEKEIPAMKRKKKRKLEKKWIPSGMFNIKEQLESNITFEDNCVKSFMPQWRKRKERTSNNHDSCD